MAQVPDDWKSPIKKQLQAEKSGAATSSRSSLSEPHSPSLEGAVGKRFAWPSRDFPLHDMRVLTDRMADKALQFGDAGCEFCSVP